MRALLVCLLGCALAQAEEPRLLDVDGKPVSFRARQTQVTVIDFWATFCAPCLDELPSLQTLSDALGPSTAVLAVSIDAEAQHDRVRAIAVEKKLTMPVLHDVDRALFRRYFPRMTKKGRVSVPQLVVVDSAGRGWAIGGYDPDERTADFVARVRRAIEFVLTRPEQRSPGLGWRSVPD